MRLLLIGFMCAGKSRVGQELAPMLRYPFVDIDRVIEERVGPLVPFFERHGEEGFRAKESEVLGELLKGPNAVIATGGGTPTVNGNLDRMKRHGVTVWIDVPIDALMPRIERAGGDRPLLLGLKGDALRQRVEELLAEREPVYVQADHIVPGDAEPRAVAERIRSVVAALHTR